MLGRFPIYANIPASDIARARAWYQEKLGLVPDLEEDGLWYRFADGTWLHMYETSFAGTAKNTQAGWSVEGIEAVMADLRARGVTFEEYDFGNGMATVSRHGRLRVARCSQRTRPQDGPRSCFVDALDLTLGSRRQRVRRGGLAQIGPLLRHRSEVLGDPPSTRGTIRRAICLVEGDHAEQQTDRMPFSVIVRLRSDGILVGWLSRGFCVPSAAHRSLSTLMGLP